MNRGTRPYLFINMYDGGFPLPKNVGFGICFGEEKTHVVYSTIYIWS